MKLSGDISGPMGIIANAISTCAYNAGVPVASFRYKDWRVILNRRQINVKDIEKEADAVEVMDYLKKLASETGEKTSR